MSGFPHPVCKMPNYTQFGGILFNSFWQKAWQKQTNKPAFQDNTTNSCPIPFHPSRIYTFEVKLQWYIQALPVAPLIWKTDSATNTTIQDISICSAWSLLPLFLQKTVTGESAGKQAHIQPVQQQIPHGLEGNFFLDVPVFFWLSLKSKSLVTGQTKPFLLP